MYRWYEYRETVDNIASHVMTMRSTVERAELWVELIIMYKWVLEQNSSEE